jgi:hypothetical protein
MVKDENIPKECIALCVKHFTSREGGNGRAREMRSGNHAYAQLAGESETDSLQEKFIYLEIT